MTAAASRLWLPPWFRAPLLFAKKPVLGPTGKPLRIPRDEDLVPALAEEGEACACCDVPCCEQPSISLTVSGITCLLEKLNGGYSLPLVVSNESGCQFLYENVGVEADFLTPTASHCDPRPVTMFAAATYNNFSGFWNVVVGVDITWASSVTWWDYFYDQSDCSGSHVSTSSLANGSAELCYPEPEIPCSFTFPTDDGTGGTATITA